MKRSSRRAPRHRPARAAALLLLLFAFPASACLDSADDLGPDPDAETVLLDASIESPHGPEGAVLLDVSTDEVLSVRALDSETEIVGRPAGERAQIAVIRHRPGTISFRLRAVKSEEPPEIRILQVADWENRLRDGLDGYRVRIFE